jgi:formate dehydrogenase subunit gamma
MADSANEERLVHELQRELERELDRPLDDAELQRIKELVRAQLEAELRAKQRRSEREKEQEEYFVRFSLNVCLQHLVLAIGVILLTITGLPIKFHDSAWAEFIFRHIWSLEINRIIHRVGASLLMFVTVWHIGWLLTREGRRELRELLPQGERSLGFRRECEVYARSLLGAPQVRALQLQRKVRVLGFGVGHSGHGALRADALVSQNRAWRICPKYIFDVALQAHSGEALLAILALITWHMYHAHLNPEVFPMNMTIFTGKISKKRMIEEHPLEYEQIMRERAEAERP